VPGGMPTRVATGLPKLRGLESPELCGLSPRDRRVEIVEIARGFGGWIEVAEHGASCCIQCSASRIFFATRSAKGPLYLALESRRARWRSPETASRSSSARGSMRARLTSSGSCRSLAERVQRLDLVASRAARSLFFRSRVEFSPRRSPLHQEDEGVRGRAGRWGRGRGVATVASYRGGAAAVRGDSPGGRRRDHMVTSAASTPTLPITRPSVRGSRPPRCVVT